MLETTRHRSALPNRYMASESGGGYIALKNRMSCSGVITLLTLDITAVGNPCLTTLCQMIHITQTNFKG